MGSQHFLRAKPVLIGRSFRTAPLLPEFVRKSGDLLLLWLVLRERLLVGLQLVLVGDLGVLDCLPGLLVSGQVLALAMFPGNQMSLGRPFVEFN
jgi:hypothetical protein